MAVILLGISKKPYFVFSSIFFLAATLSKFSRKQVRTAGAKLRGTHRQLQQVRTAGAKLRGTHRQLQQVRTAGAKLRGTHRHCAKFQKRFFRGCLLLIISMISCKPEKLPVNLDPPPTPVLTSRSIWGVVNKPYLKLMKSSSMETDVTGVLRRGYIAQVITKVEDTDGSGYWLEIILPESRMKGWVRDIDFDVYDTEPQARTAREAMLVE